jgi:glutathione synthase
MRALDKNSVDFLNEDGESANWVLKNQGEGGGHCLFDEAMVQKIDGLNELDYAAWTLMRRLRPVERAAPTVIVRNGESDHVAGLVSELGFFTAHFGGNPLLAGDEPDGAYQGYLVRSKPPGVTEGGIHSGYGVLDSLIFNEGNYR